MPFPYILLEYEDKRTKVFKRITAEKYDEYVKEEKQNQIDLEIQMEDHTRADKEFLITVPYLMDVAKRAVELFESCESRRKTPTYQSCMSEPKITGQKTLI